MRSRSLYKSIIWMKIEVGLIINKSNNKMKIKLKQIFNKNQNYV
jgi:hypothetical protein